MAQGSMEDENEKHSIEHELDLRPSMDEDAPAEGTKSYLARLDHIKQLYRYNRFKYSIGNR